MVARRSPTASRSATSSPAWPSRRRSAPPPGRAAPRARAAALRRSRARADPARLAHHADAAGDGAAVLRFAPGGGRRAASLGAHREAAAQYARALRFADGLPRGERPSCSSAAPTSATSPTSSTRRSRRRSAPSPSPRARRPALGGRLPALALAPVRFLGRTKEAAEVGHQAVALPRGAAARPRARAGLRQPRRTCTSPRTPSRPRLEREGARARRAARRRRRSRYALTNVGMVELFSGGPQAPAQLERSLELAQRAGLEEHAGRAYANLVWWPLRRRRYDVVDRYLEDGSSTAPSAAWTCGGCSSSRAAPAWSSTGGAGPRRRIRRHALRDRALPVPRIFALGARARPGPARRPRRVGAARRGARAGRADRRAPARRAGRRSRAPRPRGWKATTRRSRRRPRPRSSSPCAGGRRGPSASSPAGGGGPATRRRSQDAVAEPVRGRTGRGRRARGRALDRAGLSVRGRARARGRRRRGALRARSTELQRLGARPAAAIVAPPPARARRARPAARPRPPRARTPPG